MKFAQCDDCEKIYKEDEWDQMKTLAEASHLWERLEAGGEVPVGECECGAFCFLFEPARDDVPVDIAVVAPMKNVKIKMNDVIIGQFTFLPDHELTEVNIDFRDTTEAVAEDRAVRFIEEFRVAYATTVEQDFPPWGENTYNEFNRWLDGVFDDIVRKLTIHFTTELTGHASDVVMDLEDRHNEGQFRDLQFLMFELANNRASAIFNTGLESCVEYVMRETKLNAAETLEFITRWLEGRGK